MSLRNGNGHHDGRAQSIYGAAHDLITQNQAAARLERVVNAFTSRLDAVRRTQDPRRDINDECGYPRDAITLTPDYYRDLIERDPIASRAVEVLPRESWQKTPLVYEDEDADAVTAFEEAWDALGSQLYGPQCWYKDEEGSPVWAALKQLDIDSRKASFAVLLIATDDGRPLHVPAEGVVSDRPATNAATPYVLNGRPVAANVSVPSTELTQNRKKQAFVDAPFTLLDPSSAPYEPDAPEYPSDTPSKEERRLLFLRSFPEYLVEVVSRETNPFHPRFGQPTMYRLTLDDPREPTEVSATPYSTVRVHWSRVVHLDCDAAGGQCLRPVLNRLLDLRKVYGADAEAYWKNAVMKLLFETNPALGGDVDIDYEALKDQVERMDNGQQKWAALIGLTGKSIAPAVVDPTAHVTVAIQAVCVYLGIPMRVFMGSERGELASSQDDAAWNDRLRERQGGFITPKIIVPFIDRLIALGVLPEPESYCVEWPDLDSLTKKDKADNALKFTQALAAYVSGGLEAVMTLMDYLTRVWDFTEEEAQAVINNTDKEQEEKLAEDEALADEHGFEPAPPPGFKEPPPPPGTMPAGGKPGFPPKPAANVFCPTGAGGGIDPTCPVGGAGAPARKQALYKGHVVTVESHAGGGHTVVEGPKEWIGKRLQSKKPAPAAEPPKPAVPAAPKPATPAPAKPASFKTPEEAEDHFAAAHGTNLKKGKAISDAEFTKAAEHLSGEYDRMGSEFKAVRDTLKRRSARAQSLELGRDFAGEEKNTSGMYRYGEGIELAKNHVDPGAAPRFGAHTVSSDLAGSFRHELGHEVFQTTFSDSKRRDWVKSFEQKYVGTSEVSRYGGTNAHELFSEAFSAYTAKNYQKGSLPKDIEAWMDRHVKGEK